MRDFKTERYILSTLPILYIPSWKKDGSSFISSDGYAHSCTVYGALWRPQGRKFDKLDDYVAVPDASSIQNIFDSGGTVIAWINPSSGGEDAVGYIIIKYVTAGWGLDVQQEAAGAVKIRFFQVFTTATGIWVTTLTAVSINAFTQIAVTYNNGATTNDPIFYINGSALTVGSGLTETVTPTGIRSSDVGANLNIGSNAGANTFDNIIGELLFYKGRILTASEVMQVYQSTKWRYS